MSEPIYTVFITNNHPSLHLWCQENLLKHQKVLNYYDHECLQILVLLFIFSLAVPNI